MTAKSEKFAQGLFSGLSQRQAYKAAYDPGYCDDFIDSRACLLAATSKVTQRLDELNKPVVGAVVATVTKRKEKLTKILDTDLKDVTPSHVLTAIDTLNKMDNLYKPQDIPIGDITIVLKRDTTYNVSPEQALDSDETSQDGQGEVIDGEVGNW